MRTVTLTGLHGTSGRALEAVLFSHAESGVRLLEHHRAVSSVGPLGRVNVWRDDEGRFRCERMYFIHVRAATTFKTLPQVESWLRENLPLIGRVAA